LSRIASQLTLPSAPIDQSSNTKAANAANAASDGEGFAAQLARVDTASSDKKTSGLQTLVKENEEDKGQQPSGGLAALLAAVGEDSLSSLSAAPDSQAQVTTGSQTAPSTINAATLNNVVLALAGDAAEKPQTDTVKPQKAPTVPAAIQPASRPKDDTGDALAALLALASGEAGSEIADASSTSTKPSSRQANRASDTASQDLSGTATPSPFSFQNLAMSAQAAMNALTSSQTSATAKAAGTGQSASTSGTLAQQLAAQAKDGGSPQSLESMLGINLPTQAAADVGNATQTDGSVELIKMDVSRIQAETHLIPPPAQQVADFIAGSGLPSLGSPNFDAAVPASNTVPATHASQVSVPPISLQSVTSPLKVLTLTLEPQSLGSVTVTMRLNDSGLNVQLDAAQASTASLIEQDKKKITDKLQSLGYAVEGIDVKTAVTVQKMDQTSQGASGDQPGAMQGQQARQEAGTFSSGSGSRNDQAPADGRHESRQSPVRDETSDPARTRSIGDGLYV